MCASLDAHIFIYHLSEMQTLQDCTKRYSERELSDLKLKRAKLVRLAKTAEYETLKKLGKNIETKKRR